MKVIYEAPALELIRFSSEDIMTSSLLAFDDTANDGFDPTTGEITF